MSKKTLIIVESPTKAKTIGRFLGNDCTIIASKGHIRMLPPIGMGIDIEHGYTPEYIMDSSKSDVVSKLKSALKESDELILATDEDREGESISWHLVEVLKPKIPYRRMVFHEITKKAILQAFENGRELDMNMVHAQEARRVLDRLYGFTISPVLWSKLSNKTLSAGRVQSPGLRLIVDRERTRLSYQKNEYWDIKNSFAQGFSATLTYFDGKRIAQSRDFDSDTGSFKASPKTRLLTKEDCAVVMEFLKGNSYTVTDVKEKHITQVPAPPFKTSTLQQEGNRKLHLSAKDTMKIAQSLYEQGFITYMRTDSLELSDEGINAAREAAVKLCGPAFIPESPRKYASSAINIQEAHEAIRPAGDVFKTPEETGLSGRELALYTMIFKRTLACQMKDASKVSTSVSITTADEKAVFNATGTRIEFPGFIKLYVESTDDDEEKEEILPKLVLNQQLSCTSIEPVFHQTKEPGRFTEATLVQELEKRGIGRPSTYASIIDRIIEKDYVKREKNGSLIPTFTGFSVIQLLENFTEYIDYDFTSDMEQELDEIAKGKSGELDYLKKFYEGANGLKQQVETQMKSIVSKDVKLIRLPQLNPENYITMGKFGPYVQDEEENYHTVPKTWMPCDVTNSDIEKLKNTSDKEEDSSTPVVGTTEDGQPILYCTGRFGDYWQIGDLSKTKDVKRFKVPQSLLGKEVPCSRIIQFFNLPRVIGHTEDGSEISANIGKYGPYLKCNDDYRNFKDIEEIFTMTELEARKILSEPRAAAKKPSKAPKSAPKAASASKEVNIVKDFGVYDGQTLDIREGRYGFYLKWGEKNYRIAQSLQHDEQACKNLSVTDAAQFIKL